MANWRTYITAGFELLVWTTGLLLLAFMNPGSSEHFSLCLFNRLGFTSCPGCGIGHAISWLFHGNLNESWRAHPLGIVAVPVLLHRIYFLARRQITLYNNLKQQHANNR